jgi:predicted CXXCH cytochrome family protein
VRRWTLLLAGAALWLFLAAIPALADGGPHTVAINSGSGTGSTLTADSCAGCHRAHTAQGPLLINAPDEEALCLTCHGTTGGGATTSVVDGVQYAGVGTDGAPHTGAVAGALRGGGFVNARIDSSNPTRLPLPRWDSTNAKYVASFSSRVPALAAGAPVTSAHLALAAGPDSGTGTPGAVALQGTAWGSGAAGSGVGATSVTLECATCHNPHGNGNYRILNPVPDVTGVTVTPATGAAVPEVRAVGSVSGARNYTVNRGASLATIVAGSDDYWRRYQPYDTIPQIRTDFNPANPASSSTVCATNPANNGTTVNCPVGYPAGYFAGDVPEFVAPNNPVSSAVGGTWRTQISAWCSTCHTRYNTVAVPSTGGASYSNPLVGEDIFKYRHPTSSSLECTKCHVAHGSNAQMPGNAALGTDFSNTFDYPVAAGGTAVSNDSSRLLKVDNRGTCQQCHDPTGTVAYPTTPFPTP